MTLLGRVEITAYIFEALPLSDFAGRGLTGFGYASVDEVSYRDKCQYGSDHVVPSFLLPCDIDSRVASQVLVFVLTLEVSFAGINVSFTLVIKVILGFIFGHDIISLINCLVFGSIPSGESNIGAEWKVGNTSLLAGRW